ncbi:VacJ family lipoprotein [Phenylobacterium sp.]|jgi:phospholipid-binding lipoprotein MlaA|uniref:MlaA family lipoprotein n=1 Tax=Phenylobacterium sp. TaxID=1871053 RepID=UPI002F3F6B44
MRPSGSPLAHAYLALAALSLAGPCRAATAGDPFEGFNRRMFGIEESVDRHLFGPVSRSYGAAPSPVRSALRNWSQNLGEPVVAVNDVLQGRIGTAASTVARFVINTTLGLVGFVDVAGMTGLPHHDNGFGTTLGRWGAKPGPYLFLPLTGPTTVRDGLGSLADFVLGPLGYVRIQGSAGIGAASVVIDTLSDRVDSAADLARIRQTSTDPYATLRSYFLQNRQTEITGKAVDIETLPDLDAPAPSPVTPPATPPSRPPETDASATHAVVSMETAAAPAPDEADGEEPAA